MPKTLSKALVYIVLIFFSIIFLIPFYVLFVTSFKSFEELSFLTMWNLPSSINFSSFAHALKQLLPNLWNSIIMAVPATIISCILGSINGYALSKWRFKGSEWVFTFILLGMFIPFQSILIPLIRVVDFIGL